MIERICLAPLALLLLAGCSADPAVRMGHNIAARHPIVVQDTQQAMTIAVAPQLDAESRMKIAAFASAWRQDNGRQIEARIPDRSPQDKMIRAQFDRIRHELVAEGVQGSVHLVREPARTGETPVISLQFTRTKAGVVTRCGLWPDDLASGSTFAGWDNEPYANFGCSYQNMLAVQTADPRDLTAMRAPSPADGEMRTRTLNAIRRGQSPSVMWGGGSGGNSATAN